MLDSRQLNEGLSTLIYSLIISVPNSLRTYAGCLIEDQAFVILSIFYVGGCKNRIAMALCLEMLNKIPLLKIKFKAKSALY